VKKPRKNKIVQSIETEIEEIETGIMHRWSFLVAVLVIGALLSVLSENLTFGPSWFILALVVLLLVPLLTAMYLGHHRWTRRLSLTITLVLTVGLISSVVFLVDALFRQAESGLVLFRNAAVLWVVNVILFAIWYWEVDQGGPIRRHTGTPEAPDLLFPQMTIDMDVWNSWKPTFSDYVFVAFNSSTAFSPTDTLVLSTRAKILMMTQASISLVVIAVLAARAINIA
jgi:hypothetical protein